MRWLTCTMRALNGACDQKEAEAMLPMQHASASTKALKAEVSRAVAHSASTPPCLPWGVTYLYLCGGSQLRKAQE